MKIHYLCIPFFGSVDITCNYSATKLMSLSNSNLRDYNRGITLLQAVLVILFEGESANNIHLLFSVMLKGSI